MSEPQDTIAQMVRRHDPDRYFSALFAPVYPPAIETGVTAMTAMALDLLK